jgi:hypothetical protein
MFSDSLSMVLKEVQLARDELCDTSLALLQTLAVAGAGQVQEDQAFPFLNKFICRERQNPEARSTGLCREKA